MSVEDPQQWSDDVVVVLAVLRSPAMLLRRFMKHFADQNWFAVGLDVLVVVLGIFLGMQVNEWNNSRHLRSEEAQYLRALDVDIRASKQHLIERMERLNKQSAGLDVILDAASNGVDDLSDIDAARAIHNGLNSAAILPVQLRTYEDLKGSNAMAVLKNIQLRHRLRELDSHLLQIRQEESERLKTLYGHVDPLLLKYPSYVELTRFWRNFQGEGLAVEELLGIHSAKEIFADTKLVNLSILMMGITRTETRFLNDLMPLYDAILEEISADLKNKAPAP